jgi:hypothetical protein
MNLTAAEVERLVPPGDPALDDHERWYPRHLAPTPWPIRREVLARERLAAEQREATATEAEADVLRELVDLRVRIAKFEELLGPNCEHLVEGIGSALPEVIHRETSDLKQRLTDLEARQAAVREPAQVDDLARRIAGLERDRMRFRGVHKSGEMYWTNDLVIRSGSLWICLQDTVAPPGSSSADWQLCVKRGAVSEKGPVYA